MKSSFVLIRKVSEKGRENMRSIPRVTRKGALTSNTIFGFSICNIIIIVITMLIQGTNTPYKGMTVGPVVSLKIKIKIQLIVTYNIQPSKYQII